MNCTKCGKKIKYLHYYKNKPYGSDCFDIVAKEFIEQRDLILNSGIWNYKNREKNLNRLNKLAKKYGVRYSRD